MSALRALPFLFLLLVLGCGSTEDAPPDAYAPFDFGLSRAARGDFAGATGDLRGAVELAQPDALTARLWLAAVSGETVGLEASGDPFYAALVEFLKGEIEADVLLVKSKESEDADLRARHRCAARLYIGLVAERNGKLDEAKQNYELSGAPEYDGYLEPTWSRKRLSNFE